jgi:hypothetical protein
MIAIAWDGSRLARHTHDYVVEVAIPVAVSVESVPVLVGAEEHAFYGYRYWNQPQPPGVVQRQSNRGD